MLPATSLINEKQKRTLRAVLVTPAGVGDVFVSKALMGIIISFVMGIIVLVINQAFGSHPWLMVVVLFLGATMAAQFGLLLGIYAKDITTLFAAIKTLGILLYAPAIVYMFPQLPEWAGRVFPTFYFVYPVVTISQRDGSWADISLEVFILAGLIVALSVLVGLILKRKGANL